MRSITVMDDRTLHDAVVRDPAEWILSRCRDLGFALAGVCDALPTSFEREFHAWLGQSKHGEMAYMARHTAVWLDPRELLPGARSIICVADRYPGVEIRANTHRSDGALHHATPGASGRIARYAQGDDYHTIMKSRLHQLCDEMRRQFPDQRFRACVDTAPLMEREHAQRAGIGAVGKHTLLINRHDGHGSWLLLGEIVTTLQLQPSASRVGEDPCGSCTRCIDACPTQAISPWSVDATRCISYLTIEHRSPIDSHFHEAMGDWIFGCDVCQEVCPHNQPGRRGASSPQPRTEFKPRRSDIDLLELMNWTETDRRAAFARSSMKRAKLEMIKRNAIIAAGHAIAAGQGSDPLLRQVQECAVSDASEMVRATARVTLARMASNVSDR